VGTKKKMSKDLQSKLLASVVEFMTRTGVSEPEIKSAFKKGLIHAQPGRARRQTGCVGGRYPRSGDISAHLLRMWHREDKYVDSREFKPRPLYLAKGRVSLRNLVFKVDPDADAVQVLRGMKDAGLIRKTASGRYLPTTSAAVIPPLHPWAAEHTAKSVVRLVSTVRRNSSLDSGTPPLLERYSYVPDLDPAEAKAFAEFARSQGQAYLDTLDDWLEQRRARPTGSSPKRPIGIAAGVHLITYLGNDADCGERKSLLQAGKRSRAASPPPGSSALRKRPTPTPATPA
jgi:hypothetical protein